MSTVESTSFESASMSTLTTYLHPPRVHSIPSSVDAATVDVYANVGGRLEGRRNLPPR